MTRWPITLVLIAVLASTIAKGQTIKTWPVYLFIDKPFLHQDSLLIIKKNIKQIKVYQLTISDSSKYDKKLFGTWTLQTDTTKIVSSKWDGTSEFYFPVDKRQYKKNKIVELRGLYELTHFIDNNQIVKTENKQVQGHRMEDGFFFDKIIYKYDSNGFLSEASYDSGGLLDPNVPYKKFIFEYFQ